MPHIWIQSQVVINHSSSVVNNSKRAGSKMEESKRKSQKLDHITEIIGIFGPFHGFWYTILGKTYSF